MRNFHYYMKGLQQNCSCRSPYLWKDPDAFRPERFSEENSNPDFGGAWAGYRPSAQTSSLYPNEVNSDFAFIPFGGGARKCVGDQFAFMEATVVMGLLLRSFFLALIPIRSLFLTIVTFHSSS